MTREELIAIKDLELLCFIYAESPISGYITNVRETTFSFRVESGGTITNYLEFGGNIVDCPEFEKIRNKPLVRLIIETPRDYV